MQACVPPPSLHPSKIFAIFDGLQKRRLVSNKLAYRS